MATVEERSQFDLAACMISHTPCKSPCRGTYLDNLLVKYITRLILSCSRVASGAACVRFIRHKTIIHAGITLVQQMGHVPHCIYFSYILVAPNLSTQNMCKKTPMHTEMLLYIPCNEYYLRA